MVYCTADIHGEFERFRRLLELICFSEEDTLYVLGDVIDRGPDGVKILEFIRERGNIILLMGNHERMCVDALGKDSLPRARRLWEQNGGWPTHMDLEEHPGRDTLLAYLSDLPLFLDIEVEGRAFRLVHGFPGETEDDMLWGRPEAGMTRQPLPGKTVIVGHTPVQYLQYLTGKKDVVPLIWHGPGILDIDCGCGHDDPGRMLACLRLDDMKEFYV